MRRLLDENVDAEAVGEFFRDRGHEVDFARDLVGAMSPDRLIAFAADTAGLIVVTHDKDFGRFVAMLPAGGRRRFEQGTGCISLRVKEPVRSCGCVKKSKTSRHASPRHA